MQIQEDKIVGRRWVALEGIETIGKFSSVHQSTWWIPRWMSEKSMTVTQAKVGPVQTV